MLRRVFCKLLVAIVIFSLLALSSAVMAQGRSAEAFEHVKKVQEKHTARLMALKGVVGTAVGLDDDSNPEVLVLLENGNVAGIPAQLDGVKVKKVVTGKIYALPKPTGPKAPRGLTVTDVGTNYVDIDWRDNRELGVTYNVYSGTQPDALVMIEEKWSWSDYFDIDLEAGTTYYYVVTAVMQDKESKDSEMVSATTLGDTPDPDTVPPFAPTLLFAVPISSSAIALNWTGNTESDLAEYRVYRSSTSGEPYTYIDSVDKGSSVYSDSGLAPDTTYYYVVTAVDESGNESDWSNEFSATTEEGTVELPIGPRPAPIGVSTGHPNITAGTIGCRVMKKVGQNWVYYALSNNHVYADENNAAIGNNVLQPGPYDGGQNPRDKIGTLEDYVTIYFDGSNNTVDAAIARCSTADLGKATPSGGYGEPDSDTLTPGLALGRAVQKYGRTTGLTKGSVAGMNATVNVGYDSGVAKFVGQLLIWRGRSFSAGGDSGSLIVTDDENCNPVGLLFAGSNLYTIANPIDDVLSAFDVSIDGK